MFTSEFEKQAEKSHAAAIKKVVLVTKHEGKKMVKKADGPVMNTNAANAFSNSFKGATGAAGASSALGKLKGMFGMGGGAANVAPKG